MRYTVRFVRERRREELEPFTLLWSEPNGLERDALDPFELGPVRGAFEALIESAPNGLEEVPGREDLSSLLVELSLETAIAYGERWKD